MASIFELLRIKGKPVSTAVPQLGIDSPLAKLQLSSQKYFLVPEGAEAADGNQLAVQIKSGFQLNDSVQRAFLQQCVDQFNANAARLRAIDTKITASVVTSVVATSLSFLPLVGMLAWVSWAASIYFINQRSAIYAEYQQSLNLLVATCNWSLGKHNAQEAAGLQADPDIRNMMTALYPVLTEAQVRHLIADEIEEGFAKEHRDYEQKLAEGFKPEHRLFTKDDNVAISKKCTEFNRCLYGHNKGGVSDFLDALASALPDLYRMAYHGCQRFKYWWQEKTHKPAEEAQAPQSSDPHM